MNIIRAGTDYINFNQPIPICIFMRNQPCTHITVSLYFRKLKHIEDEDSHLWHL